MAEFERPRTCSERERQRAYLDFILELYHAKPVARVIPGCTASKSGRMVHVGAVDAPVSWAT